MEAGLDSLGAVELRNALNIEFGLPLPPTVTMDYPTIATLAQYLCTFQLASGTAANAVGSRMNGLASHLSRSGQVCTCHCVLIIKVHQTGVSLRLSSPL